MPSVLSKIENYLKNLNLAKIKLPHNNFLILSLISLVLIIALGVRSFTLGGELTKFKNENKIISEKLEETQKSLSQLESEDQVVKNKKLEAEIRNIHDSYKKLVVTYEDVLDLKVQKGNTTEIDKLFAQSLTYLSDKNYSSASANIAKINNLIKKQTSVATQNFNLQTQNVAVNNQPPNSGYSRQKVKTDFGEYIVDVVAADLNSTRVVVDSASDSDCRDNCPVLSLADYVGRTGGFAGVNGSYFCPASYPSCVGKANSFDTLLMNKNKKYINSDNNVYSTVPAVIFSGNSARFVGQSLEWGRDTGVDAVLANQPLLVSGGNVVFGGDDEVKRATAGSRSFVGSSDSTVYIGVVHNVNAAQMARVLHAMGIKNALNLDSGGSTALFSGGYKVGPGRNIPNAIILVGK